MKSTAQSSEHIPSWVWLVSVGWVFFLLTACLMRWPQAGLGIILGMVALLLAIIGVGVYLEKRSGK